jgi:predicted nucleic acid-binding protein
VTGNDERRVVVCFDADVLIYAAMPQNPLGRSVRDLLDDTDRFKLCGSTLLLPELLIKPTGAGDTREAEHLTHDLGRLELLPTTEAVGQLAVLLGATYRLDTIDSVHLATAIEGGADVFLTNNRKDFDSSRIAEIDVVNPSELPFLD